MDDDLDNPIFSQDEERQLKQIYSDAMNRRNRTWQYYEKMRKDNPSEYRKAETQERMVKDSIALGDDFEDGDFNDKKFGQRFK